jgi:hypothetical protein
MTAWHSNRPDRIADLPWDDEREKRVLSGALRSWRRRERRKRVLEISAAVLAILIASRVFSRAADGSAMRHAPPMGGIAGTGGNGGASAGFGGSAGTG